jgi:hypothetical membrane protein
VNVAKAGPEPAVPWWGLASSLAAPLILFAGWTVAAGLQLHRYDPVRQTVSLLAAHGATDRWVMTAAFLVVGACDVITGLALRPARMAGRVILVVGGIGGMLVAANPETLGDSAPVTHVLFAALGIVALTIWPAAAARRDYDGAIPWTLRPGIAAGASTLTLVLFAWFVAELIVNGSHLGLAERAVGGVQALWPLAVVLSCRPVLKGTFRNNFPRSRL